MTTMRTARSSEGNFVQIANKLAQDTRLDDRARGLAIRALSYPPGTRLTADSLSQGAQQGRGATLTALKQLEEYGYLKRPRKQGEGGKWSTEWVLTDDPDHTAKLVDEPVDNSSEATPKSDEPKSDSRYSVRPAETRKSPGRTESQKPNSGSFDAKYVNTDGNTKENTGSAPAISEPEIIEGRVVDDFDTFWALYPRRTAKDAARKAWVRVLARGAQPAQLIEATRIYAAVVARPGAKVKEAHWWLRDGNYDDEICCDGTVSGGTPTAVSAFEGGRIQDWDAPPTTRRVAAGVALVGKFAVEEGHTDTASLW